MNPNLYVGNISYRTTPDELEKLFSGFGEVRHVRIVSDAENRPQGYAFVTMPNESERDAARKGLQDYTLRGRRLIVRQAARGLAREKLKR